MPRLRYTLREAVGDPGEWTLTWAITDDVTLGSACGFCGRDELRLTYEVTRAGEALWICPTCVSRYPLRAILDGYSLTANGKRDQVHGLTARIKQQTCQDVIRKVQVAVNEPEIDEVLVYFDRNLQLSPLHAARLFNALPRLDEPIDPRIFEIRTRSVAHQDEFGSLDEAARAVLWPALTPVQRRRLTALGHAPAGQAARRMGKRAKPGVAELPGSRMTDLTEPADLNPQTKSI